jgi:hypothetical protein
MRRSGFLGAGPETLRAEQCSGGDLGQYGGLNSNRQPDAGRSFFESARSTLRLT